MRVALALSLALALATSAAARDGKSLYHRGDGSAAAWVEETRLDAARMTCASCHGRRGQGGSEGGVRVPPVVGWKGRPGALAAILARRGSYMPRYEFSAPDVAALERYLAVLGTSSDPDPGVTASSLLIGAPASVRAALEALTLYRRGIVVDTAPPAEVCAADRVFAVVASEPNAECAAKRIPVIVAGERPVTARGPESAYFLRASFEDRARAVVMAARNASARFAPVVARPRDATAAPHTAALVELARHAGAAEVRVIEYDPDAALTAPDGATHVLFAGAAVPVHPAQVEVVTPERQGNAGRGMTAVCEGDETESAAALTGAARLLELALREAGRDLSRDRLIATLESGAALDAGVFGRVSFSASRKSGSGRCSVRPW